MHRPTDTFNWPRHAENPEGFWTEAEQRQRDGWERAQEARDRMAVIQLLAYLREAGLLRADRLSYTRICELEHETGIQSGSWADYYHELREAQQKDEGRS